jgi:YesN/AraC family two-component response regulator
MSIGILIVDDEDDIRTLMRLVIEAANNGLEVCGEAANGPDAVRHADSDDPTVIVLDERMPGMNGIEAAAQILEHRPGQRIILCSAYLDTELKRRAKLAGIKVCLPKGDIGRIPDTIRRLAVADA